MNRGLFFSLAPAFAATLPLMAAELRISVFTSAPGEAATFRELVSSSRAGTPAEQLEQFDALETYGYDFYFPQNADGTPLDWNDPAAEPVG